MIYYNMRYRGPYEYDKFTLNILNYVNYVNDYIDDMDDFLYDIKDISTVDSNDFITLKQLSDEIDKSFNTCMQHLNTVYREFILNKEGD